MDTKMLFNAAPALMSEWQRSASRLAEGASIEPSVDQLVEIRASQINGCANCLNLHVAEAREHGETNQRLDLLAAWREAPCYSERERAALRWTEALTRLSEQADLKSALEELKERFTLEEQVKLTLKVNLINSWNRLAVGFGIFSDHAALRSIREAALA